VLLSPDADRGDRCRDGPGRCALLLVLVGALRPGWALARPAEATMDNATAAVRNFFMALVSLPAGRRSGGLVRVSTRRRLSRTSARPRFIGATPRDRNRVMR
jgi:hypothetical protein